jgi:hypothetical protein
MATCAQVAFLCAGEYMNIGAYYTEAIGVCGERLEQIRLRSRAVSGLRLLVFGGLVWAVVELIQTGSVWWAAGTIGFAAAFIGAVNWYFRLKDRRLLWEKLVFVNTNEWAVMQERPNGFPDGKNFLTGVIYGDDLDIFGPLSVFQALNRTTTLHGTEALAGWLREPVLAPDAIRERQEAVRALAGQADLRRLLTAKGLLAGGGGSGGGNSSQDKTSDLRTLKEWLNTPPRVFPLVWLRILIGLWTVVNVVTALYGLSEGNYTPAILSIAVTWIIIGSFSKYIQRQHQLIGHKQAVFEQYADILSVFSIAEAGGSGTSGPKAGGSALIEKLRGQAVEAHGAIRRLSQLTSFFDQRLNLLVFTFLNSLAFYDLQCMVTLERWKSRYRDRLPAWIEAVGNIEALNSLATYAFNHPGYVYPAVNEGDELFIEAKQLAHPLIPANRCVANDFRIGPEVKLILVTGSNMSGKTTFLRTIGVNVLLAQCGSPVCAAAFSFAPMRLLTSLRISDSLQEQTSYFMAELKKLQQVVEILETGSPALVLIDEILRGTNSEDKTYGSEHFARKLVGYRCLALFATHDLALGALESELPGKVANYCFESVIENGDLRFDYRLQRGIARNKNASFLMKKMGII